MSIIGMFELTKKWFTEFNEFLFSFLKSVKIQAYNIHF